MTISIIENASPYFVRFTHEGIDKIIDLCLSIIQQNKGTVYTQYVENLETHVDWFPTDISEYEHDLTVIKLDQESIEQIIDLIPWKNEVFDFKNGVIFIMKTGPGWRQTIHKDRSDFGLNYVLYVADDKCITTFYNEQDVKAENKTAELEKANAAALANPETAAREVNPRRFTLGVDPDELTPVKTYIAKQGEAMLLNTDIYHTWHNDSPNHRYLLGIRLGAEDLRVSFDEAKEKMLGNAI